MCLYLCDYTMNHKESEDQSEKRSHVDMISIDLGLQIDTNIVNIRIFLVR